MMANSKATVLESNNLVYLLVPVDHVSWMQVFDGFEELVHHITFVDVFEQRAFLYDCMQVGICAKGQCFNKDFHRNQGEVTLMQRFDYYDFTPELRNQDLPQISVCMNEKWGGKEEVCAEAVTLQSEGHAAADSAVDTHTHVRIFRAKCTLTVITEAFTSPTHPYIQRWGICLCHFALWWRSEVSQCWGDRQTPAQMTKISVT